jgi:hypothetical protein
MTKILGRKVERSIACFKLTQANSNAEGNPDAQNKAYRMETLFLKTF